MTTTSPNAPEVLQIPLELVDPDPAQPRPDGFDVADLVESMRPAGLLQPIVLRPHPDQQGRFMVVFGHRRRQAALVLGWTAIPALLRPDFADWRLRLVAQAHENERRVNLSLLDRCSFYLKGFEQSGLDSARRFAQEIGFDPGDLSQILHVAKASGALRELLAEGYLNNIVYFKLAKKLPEDRLRRLLLGCRRNKTPLSQKAIDAAMGGPTDDDEGPPQGPTQPLRLPHGDRLRPTVCRALVGVRNLLTPEVLSPHLPAEQIDLLLEFLAELEHTALAA
jgi:ParB/RepB/Spo0J family partition protein